VSERVSFDLSGKRALVTGGRGGIGMAIARALGDGGARVTITGLGDETDIVEGFPFRRLDLRDPAAIEELRQSVDRLDILVNCAGATVRDGTEYDPEVFARIVDLNLNGTYRMCHAFLPQLKASRGSVINIASTSALLGSPHGPAYGAGKAGMVQLTKSLAMAWAKDGIRVNAIAPGWIRTKMNVTVQDDEASTKRLEARIPLGRWGLPHEIAGAAVYLASPAASFTTGTTIVVDGGYSIV
jgi:NAD(P)-dependent dehydrogenase (short-subunit alcohol dehydrogenase family)